MIQGDQSALSPWRKSRKIWPVKKKIFQSMLFMYANIHYYEIHLQASLWPYTSISCRLTW